MKIDEPFRFVVDCDIRLFDELPIADHSLGPNERRHPKLGQSVLIGPTGECGLGVKELTCRSCRLSGLRRNSDGLNREPPSRAKYCSDSVEAYHWRHCDMPTMHRI